MQARIYEQLIDSLRKKYVEAELTFPEDLTPQTAFAELELDSLKVIEIVFEMETIFQVEADEDQLHEIKTLEDLTKIILRAHETADI